MNFWKEKSLNSLSDKEWESLCDGCGLCCLLKLEGEYEVNFTRIACKLFDLEKCTCSNYNGRFLKVLDCLHIREEDEDVYRKLPPSCSYRLLFEGEELPEWHYLISGDRELVHKLHKSAKGICISEIDMDGDDLNNYIIELE